MKPLCPHFQVVLFVCKILQNEICEFLLNFRFWPHLALTGFDISIVIIVIIITHRFFDLKLCMSVQINTRAQLFEGRLALTQG